MEAEGLVQAEEAAEAAKPLLDEAEEARRAANNDPTPEELEKNKAAQIATLKALVDKLRSNSNLTEEDVQTLSDIANKLADDSDNEAAVVTKLDGAANNIPPETAERLNTSMRPFLENASSKIGDLIKKNSGSAKYTQYQSLQSKLTQAVKDGDENAYKDAAANLDSFIDNELGNSNKILLEVTEGRGSLKKFSRISSFLKLLTIAGILGLITVLFKMDDGCWKWTDGAKTVKITDFDFSDDNKKYCSCSSTSNFETPQPLSSWCPSGVTKGSPTYVTCSPYNYPACTIQTDPSGIYYSYYISSPIGEFNSLVNQTVKVVKNSTQGILTYVKWGVVIICILISLYLIVEGIFERDWIYGIRVLFMAGGGTAAWIYI